MLFWLSQVLVGEQECALGYGGSDEGEQVAARDAATSSWRWRSAEEFVASLTHHNWETLLPHAISYTRSPNGALILYSQNQTTKMRIPTFAKSTTFCRIHCNDDRALEASGSVNRCRCICGTPERNPSHQPFNQTQFYVREIAKVTISFVMRVCPSAWNNKAPCDRAFMKLNIWKFFGNMSRKFE